MNGQPISRWLVVAVLATLIAPRPLTQATSTPEERAHWANIVHKLEGSPLDANVNAEGDKALRRITEVHDFHVPLCAMFFNDFNTMKYKYARVITRQFMLATAAFLIEDRGEEGQHNTIDVTAVESVLKTYTSILQEKPDARSGILDDLLQKQKQGSLGQYVRKRCGSG